ncbi:MAG: response regulator transcription factor [Nitrospirae bacterium]|nr:response regulator transcription factor [Nitrospirota bacterium]MBI5096364.1 response regulator transcription factor [Nitrospirota bacterium]
MIQQNPSSPKETPGKSISILVVDDHTLFRQGLRRLFESEEGFTIIGEAADGEEAIRLARTLRPDIILMDLSMPNLNGTEATSKIKRILPETDILLLTMHDTPFMQEEGLRMGASGYVLKRSADRELFEAIRRVRSGHPYFQSLSSKAIGVSTETPSYETLSRREKEILGMLANGMTNKEIARQLCISISTVETHRKNIMKKLNIHNLSEIIKYAMAYGIIQR